MSFPIHQTEPYAAEMYPTRRLDLNPNSWPKSNHVNASPITPPSATHFQLTRHKSSLKYPDFNLREPDPMAAHLMQRVDHQVVLGVEVDLAEVDVSAGVAMRLVTVVLYV